MTAAVLLIIVVAAACRSTTQIHPEQYFWQWSYWKEIHETSLKLHEDYSRCRTAVDLFLAALKIRHSFAAQGPAIPLVSPAIAKPSGPSKDMDVMPLTSITTQTRNSHPRQLASLASTID